MILTPIAPTGCAARSRPSQRRSNRHWPGLPPHRRPGTGRAGAGQRAAAHHRQALALASAFGMGAAPRLARRPVRLGRPGAAHRHRGLCPPARDRAFPACRPGPAPARRFRPGRRAGDRRPRRRRATREPARHRPRARGGDGLAARHPLGGCARPAGARLVPRSELARGRARSRARHGISRAVLARLAAGGFVTATGRPTRRLRRNEDVACRAGRR